MPKTSGILNIVAGAFSLLALFLFGMGIMFFSIAGTTNTTMPIGANEIMVIFWVITVPKVLLSILAIIGGVYALKKRAWGLALAL